QHLRAFEYSEDSALYRSTKHRFPVSLSLNGDVFSLLFYSHFLPFSTLRTASVWPDHSSVFRLSTLLTTPRQGSYRQFTFSLTSHSPLP
ncbi:hypothetical protein PFISCL1PPCAC_192, partial [Pristionchus fissidentatus]